MAGGGTFGRSGGATYPVDRRTLQTHPQRSDGTAPAFLQHLLGQQTPGPLKANANQGVMFPDMYINSPGYDYSAQIRAMYDQLQSRGKKIYGKTQGTLKDIYGDLRSAYEPAQENTRVRFDTATTSTANAKAAGDAAEALRSSAEDAARRDMLAKMGIANQGDTGSGGASVDLAREEGATNREALQNNWAGLMGSLSASQQGRDASALRGVGDQETMALEELATRWSDYQNQLAQREAQSMQGARGGGGRTLNPIYSQMASSNPMIAMMARQSFANQSGMSPDQINSIFNPQGQGGVPPELAQMMFGYGAKYGETGQGGANEFYQSQLMQDLGPQQGAAAWQAWLNSKS